MINPSVLQGLAGGQSVTGEMAFNDVAELRKALEAGYGTDVSTLTGGGALRIQSLEKTMLATIQENKHFALFNELAKTNATATVDEWTEQSGVGGFLGGSTNSELGVIASAQGQYARRVGMVKYLMTRREVSFVQTLQNAIADSEAVEAQNGALQLLSDAEYLCWEGDDTVVGTEFSGIKAQILDGVASGQVSGDNVIDAEGESLSSIDAVNKASAQIAGYGNFGTPTHIFMSQLTQSDFDTGLDPAFRVPLTDVPGGGIQLGSPVVGIRTSWGNIKTINDVFIRDERQQMPFQVQFPVIAAANAGFAPTVAVDASVSDASSKFGAGHAGNYYWLVTGVNAKGQSTGVITAQTAVAAGKKAVLTITASAGGEETGYVIYRSRLNGTNAPSDFRQMARIPKAGATTTFTDLNRKIPGTTTAYVLNMAPGAQAITWRQLLPMLKFPLYPTVSATIPWAQLMFGYLRIGKRKHHCVIENIVPNGAQWKPFA
jgi:hypothetical protein